MLRSLYKYIAHQTFMHTYTCVTLYFVFISSSAIKDHTYNRKGISRNKRTYDA
jgi:hypothetical protein